MTDLVLQWRVPGAASAPVAVRVGPRGLQGYSAFEVAQAEGFAGTEEEWLESLIGGVTPELEVLHQETILNAADAAGSAGTATTKAGEAAGSAGTATTKASEAASSETIATGKAGQASDDADLVSQVADEVLASNAQTQALANAMVEAADSHSVPFSTYALAAAHVGYVDNQRVSVMTSDTGTHASITGDVGASGGQTPNSGIFVYSTSLSALVRAGVQDSALAKAYADEAEASAHRLIRIEDTIPPPPETLMVEGIGEFLATIADEAKNFGAGLDVSGAWVAKFLRAFEAISAPSIDTGQLTLGTGSTIVGGEFNYDFCICDENNEVLFGLLDGQIYPQQGEAAMGEAYVLDTEDARAKAHSHAVYMRRVSNVQRPTTQYCAFYLYGQSLAQGDETWPALSRTAVTGTYMLGGNTMSSTDNATFTQFTPTGIQPLVAQTVNGATRYDAAGEAALAPGNGSRGEPPNIGWARGAKLRLNDYLLLGSDATRSLVTINVARSGATIGELEESHSEGGTEYYSKYTGSLTQLVAAVGASTLCVAGITYMQGEHDYYQASGHTSLNITYAAYKAKLVAMIANMQADAITATGQAKPPAFLLYQTGAAYTRDADINGVPGMHVGMAQLDAAMAADSAWMVGPIYPYTDKGGHFDSNGSRWFGHQIAKVWSQVVVEGRDWEPLRPLRIWQDGQRTIYVSYHVPFAPLVFDEPQLSGGTEYNNASKGFRVSDASGAVGLSNVEIVRDTIIKLTCSRDLVASPKVWYASQGTTGNGMVRDSDPALASDNYVYEPERGMYASANIPQFVNKPYPLWNWGVGFVLPVGHQE